MGFQQRKHLIEIELFGVFISIAAIAVDHTGIGVVCQQHFGDGDVVVVRRIWLSKAP